MLAFRGPEIANERLPYLSLCPFDRMGKIPRSGHQMHGLCAKFALRDELSNEFIGGVVDIPASHDWSIELLENIAHFPLIFRGNRLHGQHLSIDGNSGKNRLKL